MATKDEIKTLVRQDRTELLRYCQKLTPEQWDQPSLCAGWRVRDVVAHIIAGQKEAREYLTVALGRKPDAINAKQVERRATVPTSALVDELGTILELKGLAALLGEATLLDNWVHQEDIRRPLGSIREPSPQLAAVLLDTMRKQAAKAAKKPWAGPDGGPFTVRAPQGEVTVTLGQGAGATVAGPAADAFLVGCNRLTLAESRLQVEGDAAFAAAALKAINPIP